MSMHRYESKELEQSTTVIKYMATRTSCPNLSNYSFQGSLRNFHFCIPSPRITSHGLASLVENPTVSGISSIDGELTLHEQRDLSNLTETLTDTILHCCSLDVHNRAQELQIEWLENNAKKIPITIEKMFRAEIQAGRQLIDDTFRHKSDYEKQLNDNHQSTNANNKLYQQLLAKRNAIHRELFEYQRHLAQNRAESEFLRIRIGMFNDEIQFYKLKNDTLHARTIKLEYELNEEIVGKENLQMECAVLENEKITREDIRGSIDFNQIATTAAQPSNYYREQLNHHIRQMRLEYNKKLQIYRDELYRKYELESHRHKIHQQHLIPTVMDEYQREKNQVEQEICAVRGSFKELENRIGMYEKQIDQAKLTDESVSNSQKRLVRLEGIIDEREEELEAVIRLRTKLKQQIENYREEVNRHSKQTRKPSLRTSVSQEWNVFNDFHAEQDCEELNRLFHQSNVKAINIINILCHRTVVQRLQIRYTFQNLFGQNLGTMIDSKMDGNAKKLLKSLLLSPIERDCYEFRRVLQSNNIDDTILIEIFLSRSNQQIQAVVNNYPKLFKTTLEEDISSIRDTPSKRMFLALLQTDRPEDPNVKPEKITEDARDLYETNSQWRTDGSTFIQLVCNRSNEQLKQIFDAYQQFGGIDIEQSIKIDTDAELSRTLMAIVRIVRNRTRFFAYELRKSLKGSSTNEDTLNRIILSRCELDMLQIQSEYEKISKRTLHDQIQANTSGDYQQAILELLNQRIEPMHREIIFRKLPVPPQVSEKWKETADINRLKQLNRFDRNNQAKRTTLSTINPRLSQSQLISQYSNGNYDE